MMKFKVSPSVRAAAVPTGTGFAGFDGLKRTCVKYQAAGGKLRCKKFRKGRGHPVCDKRLTDGGRSPGLVRPGRCRGSTFTSRRRRAR
jgi:hypothetical protein